MSHRGGGHGRDGHPIVRRTPPGIIGHQLGQFSSHEPDQAFPAIAGAVNIGEFYNGIFHHGKLHGIHGVGLAHARMGNPHHGQNITSAIRDIEGTDEGGVVSILLIGKSALEGLEPLGKEGIIPARHMLVGSLEPLGDGGGNLLLGRHIAL